MSPLTCLHLLSLAVATAPAPGAVPAAAGLSFLQLLLLLWLGASLLLGALWCLAGRALGPRTAP